MRTTLDENPGKPEKTPMADPAAGPNTTQGKSAVQKMSDSPDPVFDKAKYDFLIAMYKGMWDNINRHITVLWQSAGVVSTSLGATFILQRTGVTPGDSGTAIDVASAIVIAAGAWLVAHSFDAANWYNRNIQIISNIERVFFAKMDPSERVHPYAIDYI